MSQDVSGTERGFLEQMSLSRLSLWGTLRAVGRGLREAVAPARQPPAPRQLLQADWREQSREQKARGVWGARPTARTEPQPVRGQGGTNCVNACGPTLISREERNSARVSGPVWEPPGPRGRKEWRSPAASVAPTAARPSQEGRREPRLTHGGLPACTPDSKEQR